MRVSDLRLWRIRIIATWQLRLREIGRHRVQQHRLKIDRSFFEKAGRASLMPETMITNGRTDDDYNMTIASVLLSLLPDSRSSRFSEIYDIFNIYKICVYLFMRLILHKNSCEGYFIYFIYLCTFLKLLCVYVLWRLSRWKRYSLEDYVTLCNKLTKDRIYSQYSCSALK